MKKDGKYRYSLQFGAGSAEEIRAGELLERLGNKKSAVIVAALNAYLTAHPDLEDAHCKIEIRMDPVFRRESIEQIIRAVVEENLGALLADYLATGNSGQDAADKLEEDLAQMLDNLDLFQ